MKLQNIGLLGSLLISVLTIVVSCDHSNSDTRSSLSGPDAQIGTQAVTQQANFFASNGSSNDFGVYNGHEFFLIQVPAGDYLLTYATRYGTFYLVFRAARSARLTIGLNPGDEAHEATVYRGTVRAAAQTTSSGPVTVFSELGASGSWTHLFERDDSQAGILLIGGVGINYVPGKLLQLYMTLAGDYLLTYKTTLGTFEYEFHAPEANFVQSIGLQAGVEVLEAYILKK